MKTCQIWFALTIVASAATIGVAQPQRPRPVVSPEVKGDRTVTFRVRAPQAESVQLAGTDIPGVGRGLAMEKNDDGIWACTTGPLAPGCYRYAISIDGVNVVDPANTATSESNGNVWSMVCVPGADFMDTQQVPHGAVAEITYYSQSLQRFRRMHVYTPPGYEQNNEAYPVLYLLHGAGDCDDSWSTVGRAGYILDNLIAAGEARPMIVVMPAGHTSRTFTFGGPRPTVDEFAQDFLQDIMPCVESRYRVLTDRAHRALAGLSMGGAQTLNIGFAELEKFAYLGVFSSGVFGINRQGGGRSWEEQHATKLDNPELKNGLQLIWFATGKDDFLVETSRASVEMLKQHGFAVVYEETDGGHTWSNWRDYLHQFAPKLFQPVGSERP